MSTTDKSLPRAHRAVIDGRARPLIAAVETFGVIVWAAAGPQGRTQIALKATSK